MKAELLELLCCPKCRNSLLLQHAEEQFSEIWVGRLTCPQCAATYPIVNGMAHLFVDDDHWAPKAIEAEGWVLLHKEMGAYEIVPDSVDLQIPYYQEEPWISVARSFDISLQRLKLTGEETILDLGAGRGWAAKEFAKLGCRVVALDVVADENIGLGRAKALMDHAGVYFDRLIADGENLPLASGGFDLIFCSGALHHSSNLPLIVRNIFETLKPGGRLCAVNEPCISVHEDVAKVLARVAADEAKVGINETRPTVIEYDDALSRAGFEQVSLLPALGMTLAKTEYVLWAQDLGAVRPNLRMFAEDPKRAALQIIRFLGRRVIALVKGTAGIPSQFVSSQEGSANGLEVLLWVGGELFLLATKPR